MCGDTLFNGLSTKSISRGTNESIDLLVSVYSMLAIIKCLVTMTYILIKAHSIWSRANRETIVSFNYAIISAVYSLISYYRHFIVRHA